ncbi:hypothetical protein [Bacillus cereus]|uniref:hypothetical protein n=1 Tax=Bacillus cereus TaxID=1396 RepID=UPI0034D6B215
MGNIDKFERFANTYDNSERIQIAKVSSDAIRHYLVDAKSKNAIDFGCGTGLVGMNLLNEFNFMLFMDASQNMINQIGVRQRFLLFGATHKNNTRGKTIFIVLLSYLFVNSLIQLKYRYG